MNLMSLNQDKLSFMKEKKKTSKTKSIDLMVFNTFFYNFAIMKKFTVLKPRAPAGENSGWGQP